MRKTIILIGAGSLNIIHSLLHFIQIIQSFLLVQVSTFGPQISRNKDVMYDLLHSPYLAVLWFIVGIYVLHLGIKDLQNIRKN